MLDFTEGRACYDNFPTDAEGGGQRLWILEKRWLSFFYYVQNGEEDMRFCYNYGRRYISLVHYKSIGWPFCRKRKTVRLCSLSKMCHTFKNKTITVF